MELQLRSGKLTTAFSIIKLRAVENVWTATNSIRSIRIRKSHPFFTKYGCPNVIRRVPVASTEFFEQIPVDNVVTAKVRQAIHCCFPAAFEAILINRSAVLSS